LHLKLSDAMDHSKWRELMRWNSSDVMLQADYEQYVSGASSPGLAWIKGR